MPRRRSTCSSRNYATARKTVDLAMDATDEALGKFGVPLASDFRVVGTFRDLGRVQSWENYVGLTAKAPGVAIAKIVIGIAGRETANCVRAGWPTPRAVAADNEARHLHASATERRILSGWGKIVNGVIVCRPEPGNGQGRDLRDLLPPRVPPGHEDPREDVVVRPQALLRHRHDKVVAGTPSSRPERRGRACRAARGPCRASG